MQSRMLSFLHGRFVFFAALGVCLFALLTVSQAQPVSARTPATGESAASAQLLPVLALSDSAIAVDAGWYHTCAVTHAGGVKCWEDNTFGQLGNGSTTDSNVPVLVTGMPSATDASIPRLIAGEYHTCAEVYDDSLGYTRVKCWGSDLNGQLGHGMFGLKSNATNVVGFVDTFFSFLPGLQK